MDARSFYRETAVRGASPVQQVIVLYEQMIEDLRRASKAIDEAQIVVRTNAINHAIVVLAHLQNKINFEAGGKVARNLERYYNLVRARLIEAQAQTSKEILAEQIALLLEIRGAWIEVDHQPAGPGTAQPSMVADKPPSPEGETVRRNWRG